MKKFRLYKAISPAFRLFDFLNYYEIDNAKVACDDIEQANIFLESFNYFYYNNINVKLKQVSWDNESYYVKRSEHRHLTCERKFEKKKLGIISYTIAKHYMDDVRAFNNLMNMMSKAGHTDLGDSRNFINTDHVINILKLIDGSDLVVGHSTSWTTIARDYFDVPVAIIEDNGRRKD